MSCPFFSAVPILILTIVVVTCGYALFAIHPYLFVGAIFVTGVAIELKYLNVKR